MKKIKMLKSVNDGKTNKEISINSIVDLGEERNQNAVKNGLAVFVTGKSGESDSSDTDKKVLLSEMGKIVKPPKVLKNKLETK